MDTSSLNIAKMTEETEKESPREREGGEGGGDKLYEVGRDNHCS